MFTLTDPSIQRSVPNKKGLSKILFLKDIKRFVLQMAVCHDNEVFNVLLEKISNSLRGTENGILNLHGPLTPF